MHTEIALIGGGLAGLYTARLLHTAHIDFQLFEARNRLGGRILSTDETGEPANDGFDLGPSWFWPDRQPGLATLIQELGLLSFPQHTVGELLFQRAARVAVQRFPSMPQGPPSMRIAGGIGVLITCLTKDLPPERVHLQRRLTQANLTADGVALTLSGPDDTSHLITANQLVIALPPRLAIKTITFTPALDAAEHVVTTLRRRPNAEPRL